MEDREENSHLISSEQSTADDPVVGPDEINFLIKVSPTFDDVNFGVTEVSGRLLLIENHSNIQLILLSLKHILWVFITSLPAIISFCLISVGFSKLPYTNVCDKRANISQQLVALTIIKISCLVSTEYYVW